MSSLLKEKLMQRQQGIATNPANPVARSKEGLDRVPMSVPHQKLQVPEIPGYHLHWIRGTPDRMAQAKRAGYTLVQDDEIDRMGGASFADAADSSANTDLGTCISHIAGGEVSEGQAVRLYLMKLPEEYWQDDQDQIAKRHEGIAEALRGGVDLAPNPYDSDRRQVYGKAENRNILQPQLRRPRAE